MKPVRIERLFVASLQSASTPLPSLGTLRVFPLGLDSFLETVEVGSGDELAGLQHIVEQAT